MAAKIDRSELIKSCSQEFIKNGYFGTSMSDLGLACGGMEKSHFYYYFKSKDALFIEVLEYLKNDALSFIFQEEEEEITAKNALSNITTRAYQYYTAQHCIFGKTVLEANALQNEKINEVIHDFFKVWHKSLTKIYKETHKKKAAKELAQLSIQDLQGALMMQQLHQDDAYIKTSLDRMFERIDEKI